MMWAQIPPLFFLSLILYSFCFFFTKFTDEDFLVRFPFFILYSKSHPMDIASGGKDPREFFSLLILLSFCLYIDRYFCYITLHLCQQQKFDWRRVVKNFPSYLAKIVYNAHETGLYFKPFPEHKSALFHIKIRSLFLLRNQSDRLSSSLKLVCTGNPLFSQGKEHCGKQTLLTILMKIKNVRIFYAKKFI